MAPAEVVALSTGRGGGPALRVLGDRRLARLASKGDARAFAAIYERHHQDLFRYCRAITGNSEDAGDALQSTMAAALRALPGEDREIALRPWLFRIAHNESISLVRRRRPSGSLGHPRESPRRGKRIPAPTAPTSRSSRQRAGASAERPASSDRAFPGDPAAAPPRGTALAAPVRRGNAPRPAGGAALIAGLPADHAGGPAAHEQPLSDRFGGIGPDKRRVPAFYPRGIGLRQMANPPRGGGAKPGASFRRRPSCPRRQKDETHHPSGRGSVDGDTRRRARDR